MERKPSKEFNFIDYGIVTSLADGIIEIYGLRGLKSGELIYVGDHLLTAMVLNLEQRVSKAILFGSDRLVVEGDLVSQANSLVQVGVNTGLFGRVVDGLGNIIDGGKDLIFDKFYNIDVKAPGIISRTSVHESMPTGLKIIDSMLPIGNGQR